MLSVINMIEKVKHLEEQTRDNERQLQDILAEMDRVGHYDAELGGFVKTCDECGSTVVVTLEEIEQCM